MYVYGGTGTSTSHSPEARRLQTSAMTWDCHHSVAKLEITSGEEEDTSKEQPEVSQAASWTQGHPTRIPHIRLIIFGTVAKLKGW